MLHTYLVLKYPELDGGLYLGMDGVLYLELKPRNNIQQEIQRRVDILLCFSLSCLAQVRDSLIRSFALCYHALRSKSKDPTPTLFNFQNTVGGSDIIIAKPP